MTAGACSVLEQPIRWRSRFQDEADQDSGGSRFGNSSLKAVSNRPSAEMVADESFRNLLARLSRIDALVIGDWAMALLSETVRRDGILDRLTHNAHWIWMRGDSMRKNREKPPNVIARPGRGRG